MIVNKHNLSVFIYISLAVFNYFMVIHFVIGITYLSKMSQSVTLLT